MRRPALFSICLLAGCGAAPPALDQEVVLAYSQEVTIEQEALTLRFKEVYEDSRCPEGVQCPWSGQARIAIEAQLEDAQPQSLELNLPFAPTSDYLGYSVTLLELEPAPVAGTQTPPEEYVATLVVSRIP